MYIKSYLESVAPLYGVNSDGAEYCDDLPEGVTGHLQAVHVLAGGALDESMVYSHRRRINTAEKAKFVAAVWGAESIHFFAVLAILHLDDFKNRKNCTRTI